MKYTYLLEHSYEDERGFDIYKTLGIFSTREKAEAAQDMYSKKPGFRDYPMDCFCIDEYPINVGHWTTGFIDDDDADFDKSPPYITSSINRSDDLSSQIAVTTS